MPRTVTSILLALGTLGGCLALTVCSSGGESGSTTDPCPQGICGNNGGSTSGTTTSSSAGGASSSSGTGGGCVEAWVCGPWDGGGTDNGVRECLDKSNCGTTASKPPTQATLPGLDLNYFKCNVEPILDAKCSQLACHGTETGRALRLYSRSRLRDATIAALPTLAGCVLPPGSGTECTGHGGCACLGPHHPTEWQKDFDAARGFMLDDQANPIPANQADTSDLIQQPIVGGKSHVGIHLFSMNDADHNAIKGWLSGSTLANCNTGFN